MTRTECQPSVQQATYAASRPSSGYYDRILHALAFGSAVSILFSIAVSQILLGAGLLALLLRRKPLRFPPILMPLGLFFATTVIAVLRSADPWGGLPQIRKFFVFGIVLLVFNSFCTLRQIRYLILAWAGCAAVSASFALLQFYRRWREAVQLHAVPYDYLLDGRITGFQSHWATFGSVQMVALLMALSFLLFAERTRWKIFAAACALLIWIAIVLGLTRSIFLLGVPAGALFLIWHYKPWLTVAAPGVALLIFIASPGPIRERTLSALYPHGEIDSNSRHWIMARTGWRMITKHPWFGIGPEQIQPEFNAYLPPDVPRPLPKGWYGHLHDIYLQYAAERGVPALFCVLWMIVGIASDFGKALREFHDSAVRFVLNGSLAVMAAVMAEGFFDYNLGDSEVLTIFLTVVSCGYVAINLAHSPPTPGNVKV
jgi:O-antigen ligase